MIQARMIHNRVNDVIDKFCHGLDSEANYRAREMLLAYRTSVETIETKTKEQVAREWEQRANHSEFSMKIAKLEAENSLLKEQSMHAITLNARIQRENEELRRNYSSSTEEYKLLVVKNARRRLQCASYRRQLKALRETLGDLTNNSRTYRSSESGGSRPTSPERSDIEGGYDSATSHSSKTSGDSGSSGSSESSNSDSEWEAWCQETNFAKPGWNKSTASKLLSQKAPPSVIHIGENPMAGLEDTVSERTKRTASSSYSKSVMSDSEDEFTRKKTKDDLRAKFHSKCNREMQRLRKVAEIEREKAKNYKAAASVVPYEKRTHVMEIIGILQECLTSQDKYRELENSVDVPLRSIDAMVSDDRSGLVGGTVKKPRPKSAPMRYDSSLQQDSALLMPKIETVKLNSSNAISSIHDTKSEKSAKESEDQPHEQIHHQPATTTRWQLLSQHFVSE
ncbi:UNVERIFIED_CONTAM: hypothetical protein HDU68_002602 [Siphonaria sp. JEL0065]|nr:hypothetical protein HDU68_002602 [Siphonaria sp. JEL0065]